MGGETAANTDFGHVLSSRLPWVFAFVLTLSFLVMLATFRSPVIALTAIALNTLSVRAAYGPLVLVFQHTWAEGLPGFTSNGAIVRWLPMFPFVVLFGLYMDYHVFVVSRIREAALAGAPPGLPCRPASPARPAWSAAPGGDGGRFRHLRHPHRPWTSSSSASASPRRSPSTRR